MLVPTLGMAAKLLEIKQDEIHFSTCMAKAQPPCRYIKAEDMAKLVEEKTSIKVVLGTHDYHWGTQTRCSPSEPSPS